MDINEVQGAVHEIEMMVLVLLDAVVVTLQAHETNPNVFEVSRAAGEMISQSNPDCLGIPENRPQFVLTNRSGATRSADDGGVVTGPSDDARMELCGAGFAFSRWATFAFLVDFVATNLVSMGAVAAALLPELSIDVVRISR